MPKRLVGAIFVTGCCRASGPPPVLRFAGVASSKERATSSGENGSSDPGFRFVSISTSGTLQTDFSTAERGKTAYYALRWLSTRGEPGPWSEIAAATVAA